MTLNLVPTKWFCHKVYSCAGPNSFKSEDMAIVKVFCGQMDGQMDGQTDGPKTICPQSIEAGNKKDSNEKAVAKILWECRNIAHREHFLHLSH